MCVLSVCKSELGDHAAKTRIVETVRATATLDHRPACTNVPAEVGKAVGVELAEANVAAVLSSAGVVSETAGEAAGATTIELPGVKAGAELELATADADGVPGALEVAAGWLA